MEEPEWAIPVRGITWHHSKQRWQVYHQEKYLGIFSVGQREGDKSFKRVWLEAVAAKARAIGVSRTQLLAREAKRSQPEQSLPSQKCRPKFRGVTNLKRRYQAQITGKYIGVFDKQTKAANAVAGHTGVKVSTLKRKASQVVSVDDQIQRFKAFVRIYTDEDGTTEIMSDITASVKVLLRRVVRGPLGFTNPHTFCDLFRHPVISSSLLTGLESEPHDERVCSWLALLVFDGQIRAVEGSLGYFMEASS